MPKKRGKSFCWDAEIKFVTSVELKNSSNLKAISSDSKSILWWDGAGGMILCFRDGDSMPYNTQGLRTLAPFLNLCINACLVYMYSQKESRKIHKLESQFVQWTSWWNSNCFHSLCLILLVTTMQEMGDGCCIVREVFSNPPFNCPLSGAPVNSQAG